MGVSPENPTSVDPEIAAVVHSASSGPCPIYVGWDTLNSLGQRCSSNGLKGVAYLLTDDAVGPFHASHVRTALEEAGIPSHVFTIPRGESSKTLDNAARCYRWLAEQHAERGHFIVALGGGVVGDLAGFVAATFNRGMPFVQIPTSLAAMVDASIGGKTAVDLPTGKNLVGAFYQPRFVLADIHTLYTLPKREMASGWAEAIKHSLILDTDLFDTFESQIEAIKSLEQPLATNVIKRSIAIKAQVVTQDEKETSGLRILLNYGHTLGHALETATSYKEYLHGEAVAVGMTAAARISQEMGLLDTEEATRQEKLLQAYELPTRCPGVGVDEISSAMSRDKKTSGGSLRWVLLDRIGHALTRDDVPQALVEAVIRELT
jgi:3-dehydroquinate synthase